MLFALPGLVNHVYCSSVSGVYQWHHSTKCLWTHYSKLEKIDFCSNFDFPHPTTSQCCACSVRWRDICKIMNWSDLSSMSYCAILIMSLWIFCHIGPSLSIVSTLQNVDRVKTRSHCKLEESLALFSQSLKQKHRYINIISLLSAWKLPVRSGAKIVSKLWHCPSMHTGNCGSIANITVF